MVAVVRLVELEDGRWTCRHGGFDTDPSSSFAEALSYASIIASWCAPAEIVVHRRDGSTEQFGSVKSSARR